MQIGFIGLGIMGAHIARNLQRGGHALTVHDIRREFGGIAPGGRRGVGGNTA